jgi:LPXTG-motif cell wall-anchored protein
MTLRIEKLKPTLVSVLAACCLALSAAPALADEPGAAAPASELVVEPTATAQQPAEPAEPAPVAPASAPAAKPAQSGADEYSEEGVPTGTGEDEDSAPVDEDQGSSPAPTSSAPPATSTGSGETAAEETTSAPTGAQLPRTGADAWPIALIAIMLLATGILVRRRALAAPRS